MVRESISLTEQEALKGSVIEFVAKNEGDVLEYVRNHSLRRFDGREERVDQLMEFSWKFLLPVSFANLILAGFMKYSEWFNW